MSESSCLSIQTVRDVVVVSFNEKYIRDATQIRQIGDELYGVVEGTSSKKVVLNFASVQILSSAALGVLIRLRKMADTTKGQILIAGLRPDLKQVFNLAGLNKLFEFHETEEAALAALE